MKSIKTFALVLFFASFGFSLAASPKAANAGINAGLSGYVVDESTKETIIRASVAIKSLKTGSFTNKNGFFSINNIPPGKYEITVKMLGYETITEEIIFEKNDDIRKTFSLKQTAVQGRGVKVQGNRSEEEKREISISKVVIPVEQIKNIKIGGESDVFRTLQYLPGVLTSSQISSALFVRGGSPDQNLVLVDGSTVYNPTHIFGFISTFNGDAIKDVELIKGGFPAEYGGRLSAVLNLTQKDGNMDKVHGNASLGIISSRASLEGPSPIKGGTWFIGGRRTYFEAIKAVLPEDDKNPLPDFNFYDLNAKYSQILSDNDKVFVSGFMSADKFSVGTYGISMDLSISNELASARWNHIFSSSLFSTLNVSASKYTNKFLGDNSGYKFIFNNSITDYTAKLGFEWYLDERITVKTGLDVSNYKFTYLQNFSGNTDSTVDNKNGQLNMAITDWNYAAYAQVNYQVSDLLSVQAGVRESYWDLSDKTLIDPRASIRYQLQEKVAIKAAAGIYHQSLRLISQPDFQFFDTWLPSDTTSPASRSDHYILTIETQPAENFDLNFDFYYKRMYGIGEMNRTAYEGRTVSSLFYFGDSYSYGAEIFAQYRTDRFYGWFGYALGYINNKFANINYGEEYRPKYDRRHDLKIVAQYQIDENWEIGGTFTFQSGQSYTAATSRYQSGLPDMEIGKGKWVYSQRNGLRLPPSHQLNLMVSKKFDLFGLDAKATLDIYNVYNHKDIWFRYYDLSKSKAEVTDVTLLPILPTLSFEIKF